MKKFQILILSILLSSVCIAQGTELTEMLKKAEVALSNYDLDKAIKIYGDVLAANPENTEAKEKLGMIYGAPGPKQDLNNSVKYYGEAFTSGFMSPSTMLKYANLLQSQNDYDKARSVYNFYSNRGYSSNSLIRSVAPGYFSKINEPNSGVIIKNVEDVNSPNSDFSPSYYRNGLSFISTRKNRSKTGFKSEDEIVKNFTDIFKANLKDKAKGSFEESQLLLKATDQKFMQGPMTFTDDYGVMYITRSTAKDGKSFAKDDKKTVLMEICKVNYSGGEVENWDDITPVVLNRGEGYQNYSYAHPAFVTGKGDEMIFASNMPGGFGGNDLWYSKLVGTEWATPVNLGPEINTSGDELFPFVAKDGSLYFSSNGLPGVGGLDIFKAAKLEDMKYGQVENIGSPFNSKYDDFGFVSNETGREGYLSSNRIGGKGLDDIYSWRTDETQLCIKVIELVSKDPIKNAAVKIPCLGSKTYYTDANGLACVTVTSLKNCELKAAADGFKNNTMMIKNLQSNKIVEIPLDRDLEDRCKLVVMVLDKETNQPIPDATVNIRQTSTNEEIDGRAKADGSIRVKGISMNEFYEINASKTLADGSRYIGIPESAICKGLRNGDSVVKIVYLRKVREGGPGFEIDNILYDLNKWNIRADAALELDKIVSLLRQYPTMEIELGSHTDCRATVKYNEDLSSKRAASCVEYLVSKGISPSRLSSRGYGESQLKNGCACEGKVKSTCSDADHQKNRRTEFRIIKF
jgi:outer membrane protein OmpA-like peptidoglycan-associated protein/tetratricopeptide (TPR) repeat protein